MAGRVALLCTALLLAACGGESGDGGRSNAVGNEESAEVAYRQAYTAAWIKSCRAAAASLREREGGSGAAQIKCGKPVDQMEGNTSYDPEQAGQEGRRQGEYDGCAYAWDETYANSAVDVEPQCE